MKTWNETLQEIFYTLHGYDKGEVALLDIQIEEAIKQVNNAVKEHVIGKPKYFPCDPQTGAPVGTDGFIGLGKNYLQEEQHNIVDGKQS